MTEDTHVPGDGLRWQEYEADLMNLCHLKTDDFHLLGYAEVTPQDVWRCVQHMTRGKSSLNDMVSAILGLKIGQFMNFLTINAYKGVFHEDEV